MSKKVLITWNPHDKDESSTPTEIPTDLAVGGHVRENQITSRKM